MNLNLIAILLSLAMMLTGGAAQPDAAQPAQTSRTLAVSNIVITHNGRALRLGPEAHAGVSTDGQRAVFDFGVDLDGQKLMPIQLAVDEAGITALIANSGAAVTVTEKALAGLAGQLEAQMNEAFADAGDDSGELLRFIADEYLPAYTAILRAATDNDAYEEINAASQAVFDEVVDRGPGTPTTVQIDDDSYAVTAYSYTLDGAQLAALSDAMCGRIPLLTDYYNAVFKLYSLLPEESGLRDITSYSALFEKFGIQMTLSLEEQRSDDGTVDVMDGTLTIDVAAMMNGPQQAQAVAAEAEAPQAEVEMPTPEASEAPEAGAVEAQAEEAQTEEAQTEEAAPTPEPLVMNLHSVRLGDYAESDVTFAYGPDDAQGMEFSMLSTRSDGIQEADATVILTESGSKIFGGRLSAFVVREEGGATSYSLALRAIQQDEADCSAMLYGTRTADGLSENTVSLEAQTPELNLGVSFDVNVTDAPIEDVAGGVEAACVIDDLSEAGIEALGQNGALIGTAMQALGSLTTDASRLSQDRGIKDLYALIRGESPSIDVDDLDEDEDPFNFDFGGEEAPEDDIEPEGDALVVDGGGPIGVDFDDEPVEDDGVLAFAVPELGWLPQGWTVTEVETDTAYDWVQMSIADADGAECAYAIFFLDPEAESANYIVQENGKLLDGRLINVTDFGEGGLSVTVSENGMYGNLMFLSEAIETDTIGRIVSGIKF